MLRPLVTLARTTVTTAAAIALALGAAGTSHAVPPSPGDAKITNAIWRSKWAIDVEGVVTCQKGFEVMAFGTATQARVSGILGSTTRFICTGAEQKIFSTVQPGDTGQQWWDHGKTEVALKFATSGNEVKAVTATYTL